MPIVIGDIFDVYPPSELPEPVSVWVDCLGIACYPGAGLAMAGSAYGDCVLQHVQSASSLHYKVQICCPCSGNHLTRPGRYCEAIGFTIPDPYNLVPDTGAAGCELDITFNPSIAGEVTLDCGGPCGAWGNLTPTGEIRAWTLRNELFCPLINMSRPWGVNVKICGSTLYSAGPSAVNLSYVMFLEERCSAIQVTLQYIEAALGGPDIAMVINIGGNCTDPGGHWMVFLGAGTPFNPFSAVLDDLEFDMCYDGSLLHATLNGVTQSTPASFHADAPFFSRFYLGVGPNPGTSVPVAEFMHELVVRDTC